MKKFRQSPGFNPQDRFVFRDDLIIREGDSNGDIRARGALDADRVENLQVIVLDHELNLHFLAEASSADVAVAVKFGVDLRRKLFQGRPSGIPREVDGSVHIVDGIPALALAEIAPRDLRRARCRIDELDDAGTRLRRANSEGHRLHDKAETGIRGRALRLPQEACGRAFPGAGHGAEDVGELAGGVLREGLVGLFLVGFQELLEALIFVEHVRVEAGDLNGVGVDETAVQCICSIVTQKLRQLGMAGVGPCRYRERRRGRPSRGRGWTGGRRAREFR